MNILRVNNVELAYDSFGNENNEAVILIAGLGTQMIRWTSTFCYSLAEKGFRVIRFDNRDVGYSTHYNQKIDFEALAATLMSGQQPEIPYTLDDMARDCIGLLDALSIGQAHVVGRSMGGMIAQIVASQYPKRVLSLTSIMSSSGNPTLPQASADVMGLMTKPAPNPFEDEAGFLTHSLSFAKRISGTGYPFEEEQYKELILEEVKRAYDPGSVGRQIAAIAVSGDRRSRLANVKVPALVIHGTEDPLFVPACGEDTASAIPDAEYMQIEGMGHDLPHQLYDVVIEAIIRTARKKR
ncbi:pimeloyl-ACP methyl ester carboxylesterase [Paenibacillus turicensis]|uniref:Pimeloyl-ACP methyl ester carboxylesterase n=1 Tax=Paenibacillus turicensis TaxID=160487 RepID=A0ABS4FT16_9BACL|nr:alpha/beta hydrolase [Paenibacillus turicensis]MBP1905712.1 pimeloyl-ACP methyl ester carboxylesterase [Paenibacillus turicensis]